MRYVCLLLFLAGCDDGYLSGATDWRVHLGGDDPICSGTMQLNGIDPTQDGQIITFDGTWECETYGGRAVGDLRYGGMMFMDLEMTTGKFSGVRGEYWGGSKRQMIGEILITDLYPFAAYMK